MNITIRSALDAAGYRYCGSRWIRLKNKGFDAISINAESGAWIDHRTGEKGNFHALNEKLGLGITSWTHDRYRPQYEEWRARQKSVTSKEKRNKIQKLWRGAATAVPQKSETVRLETYRDAVWTYLASRGLAPAQWMQLIRINTQLKPKYKLTNGVREPDNVDAEMLDAGADFYFMIPMYQPGMPQTEDNICGVQRTYLRFPQDKYERVTKIGRAMLGGKGVTVLTPSAGLPPILLPADGPVLGAGESFENVASFVEKMRHPGMVLWDWSGIKNWSLLLKPTLGAPTIAFLVDFDASETGQRESAAAVRRIRASEHGKAVYLLPPESVTPDSKSNRDWNDVLVQGHDFAAEIIHAWHRSDQDMEKAPVVPDAPAPMQKGPRPAEIAQTIAQAVGRQDAFIKMENAVKEYILRYKQYLKDMDHWKSLTAAQKKVRKKPKLPPLLVNVTTGVGKSHMLRALIQESDVPILILSKNHALAADYAQAGAFWDHGRSEAPFPPQNGLFYTEDEIARLPGHVCFKHKVIQIVAEKNHIPALTACRECEHGRKFMLENYHPASQPYKDAQNWFYLHPQVRPDTVTPCLWLEHQARASRARVVVAPYQSYSETLAVWQNGEDSVPRLVIVDEIPELTREIRGHSGDMGLYVEKCDQSIEYVRKNPKDGEDSEKIIADLETAKAIFADLGDLLGKSTKQEIKIPDELTQRIKELHIDWLPGATACYVPR